MTLYKMVASMRGGGDPGVELIAAAVIVNLEAAEYASEHEGYLKGERTYWEVELGKSGTGLRIGDVEKLRPILRDEFEIWLDPANPDGARAMMEMAGISEAVIRWAIEDVRARLSGVKRTKEKVTGGYVGVCNKKGRWFGRVRHVKRDAVWYSKGCDTELEAVIERDEVIIENGWDFVPLNILTWEDATEKEKSIEAV